MKGGVNRTPEEQGLIYYTARNYRSQPERVRRYIDELCLEAGGEYAAALKAFVTTDRGATSVCMEFYISKATLYRAVRRFYEGYRLFRK